MRRHRSNLAPKQRDFFLAAKDQQAGTHVASYGHVPYVALFSSSNVVDIRVLLFTISTFHEQLVAESERHQDQSSGSFICNSKYLSLLCVILIVLV